MNQLIQKDCMDALRELSDHCVDSVITDPPAGISFMGKEWDDDRGGRKEWIAWMSEVMRECLRVLKPGAHALVWAIPRTSHWTATALEDAGFEIRDVVTHLFGSGFPKSLDISKAIDKAAGAEREREKCGGLGSSKSFADDKWTQENQGFRLVDNPITSEAKQWQGYGTALKPASEHWILVRKPLSEKTVAKNVLKHGTGGINIDASRIGSPPSPRNAPKPKMNNGNFHSGQNKDEMEMHHFNPNQGRFPANLVLSHSEHCTFEDLTDRNETGGGIKELHSKWMCTPGCAVAELDRQSGNLGVNRGGNDKFRGGYHFKDSGQGKPCGFGDSGGASRFFYCAKASKKDKNNGLEDMPEKEKKTLNNYAKPSEGRTASKSGAPAANHHPTVKSTTLMSYLIRMITPPKGIVLDPFMGSGSTGVAAVKEGFQFIGIEKDKCYKQIAEKRIFHAFPQFKKDMKK